MQKLPKTLLLAFTVFIGTYTATAQNPLGIFSTATDVGKPAKPGNSTFIKATEQYIISGAGTNIWGDHDEFQFLCRKMKGDFILYTQAEFVGSWVDYHRKIGWMIRKSLDPKSAHVNAVVHGDGLTCLQFRATEGAVTEEHRLPVQKVNVLQLERKGNIFIMRAAIFGDGFITDTLKNVDLGDEVYVGLFTCSHNADVVETGIFSNVRMSVPVSGESDQSTQMTLGSNLELLDIASGKRSIHYSVPYSIQAPNWTPDGRDLIFNNSKGNILRFNLATSAVTSVNTGTVNQNNNDHVLSFDGRMLGLSSFVKNLGGSIIYTVPTSGGSPLQVTPSGPSYLHGWSPDGKTLVFCGERNKEFDVYSIPASGGKETRLTNTVGLDDGPEYTPDGKYIYFNSVRSGAMQIWRMKPDGSEQEQITNDSLYNWFAHISPDGKSFVCLSFLPQETPAGIHPPYKHVYIRLFPITGGSGKVLAYLYGGQGSINTPSWSPDGKQIAFISNSAEIIQ